MNTFEENDSMGAVAIVGMAGRFPGADNLYEFWNNLYKGVESVRFFSRDELIEMGIDKHLLDNPRFVAADAILDGMDQFDASFFDYSAREAELMDPQHRLFLESAWEALENAGYNSELYKGRVAVYAGANLSGYMIRNICSNPDLIEQLGMFKIMIANGQDFLATKVSYKMNFMGPSVNVNTLCSSSMVAVHYACQNLQNYNCDVAIAGGVSFQVSRNEAFFYQEGGIGSSDGHCRAFDSKANGTVSGSGLAVVVLKRLEDAIADGDYIHAVIRGTGINNDGSSKNSYTAPNVEGQAECIAEAIAMSGINPETISYIDAHGTGTDLGDPIEIAALTKAFRSYTNKKQFCAIGSVKTNIGHLVNAGGLASLVKTVLSMQHKMIPPSLNFEEPNSKIDFTNSPFYVNTKLSKWETKGYPLRAGVSSFGIGGTNTHAILEEAPSLKQSLQSKRPWQLISISAKTPTALGKMTENLAEYIAKNPDLNLADIAYTLHVGRRSFNNRRIIVCKNIADLSEKLLNMSCSHVLSHSQKPKEQSVMFMFPGDGQFFNMGHELYETEKIFRDEIDRCAQILITLIGSDIRNFLYKSGSEGKMIMDSELGRTALFITEYSMAKMWLDWGIEPESLLGEGIGEYVAACISGVITLEDALKLAVSPENKLSSIVDSIVMNKAGIPIISATTGKWVTDSEAQSREFWVSPRRGLNLSEAVIEICRDSDRILIEMGPGNRICNEFTKQLGYKDNLSIIAAMKENTAEMSDVEMLMLGVGKLWLAGGKIDWNYLYSSEKRHRLPLPTYPFERQRYWIEPRKRASVNEPDIYLSSRESITEDFMNSEYSDGIITVKLNLDNSSAGRKEQYIELISLKEKIEELCKQYESIVKNAEISDVGLLVNRSDTFNKREKLTKRPRPQLETAYVPPRSEIERVIVEKWQDVLGFDTIGIYDDFFELGGHSLIAAAVATELGKRFGIQIPMRKLFETTNIAGIAELIETYQWAAENMKETAAGTDIEDGTI